MINIIIILFILILINSYVKDNFANITYANSINSNIVHIFWTGGFDSTFRICELLYSGKIVQPIYIVNKNIDGFDFLGFPITRKSVDFEIKTMDHIRKKLNNNNLLPTLYINDIKQDKEYYTAMRNIYYERYGLFAPILNQPLGRFSRPSNQYTLLALFAKNYPHTIEICVEKCGTGLDTHTEKYRTGIGGDCRLKENIPNDLNIFNKFRFPIIHLTKKDMLKIAKKKGFDNILKMTWSCWFPVNGKQCGYCDMCRHRVI